MSSQKINGGGGTPSRIYRATIKGLGNLPWKLEKIKTYIAETLAIIKKRKLYNEIHWDDDQKRQFDEYWKNVYGSKINDRWARLYERQSGVFCVEYVPEMLYTCKIEPKFNDYVYANILEDKSLIEHLCRDVDIQVPTTVAVCSCGQFYDSDRRPISLDVAIRHTLQYAANGLKMVLKPTRDSSSGMGVIFLGGDKDEIENTIRASLINCAGEIIIQQAISQHDAFARFNASSVNTIRIMTYMVNDAVYHCPLAFRIGRAGKNVDNIHAGGLVIGLTDDGVLRTDALELGYGTGSRRYSAHPDSGVIFDGYRLPAIPKIISAAEKLHGKFPHIGIISWDFSVDENERPILIEVNLKGQGIWFPQVVNGQGAFGENTKEVLGLIR